MIQCSVYIILLCFMFFSFSIIKHPVVGTNLMTGQDNKQTLITNFYIHIQC